MSDDPRAQRPLGRSADRSDRDERERAVYIISVAAELAGVHPQTLRIYERKGLLRPKRTAGNTRRYSEADIARLRMIQALTQDEGVNLAGVKLIIAMREQLEELQRAAERMRLELERQRERTERHGGAGEIVPLRAWLDAPWLRTQIDVADDGS
jgi:MerR family transcriptional regulator/heat shock protein HspR